MPNIGDAGIGTELRTTPPASAARTALDVTHRRNRLAGLWAAELLGLFGHAAQDYVRSVMHPGHPHDDVHEDDHEKVVDKLSEDLAGHVAVSGGWGEDVAPPGGGWRYCGFVGAAGGAETPGFGADRA